MIRDYKKPLYPLDWSTIAQAIKQERNWTCEKCPIKQGDDPHNNITVHHKDHNTFNNQKSNLQVLCQKCHLREEGKYRAKLRRQRFMSVGGRTLPGFEYLLDSL